MTMSEWRYVGRGGCCDVRGIDFYQSGRNCSWCSIRRKQRILCGQPHWVLSPYVFSTLSNEVRKIFSSWKPQVSWSLSVLFWKMRMIIAPLENNSISYVLPPRLSDGLLQEGNRYDFLSTPHFLFHELRKRAVRSGKDFFKICSMRKSRSQAKKNSLIFM